MALVTATRPARRANGGWAWPSRSLFNTVIMLAVIPVFAYPGFDATVKMGAFVAAVGLVIPPTLARAFTRWRTGNPFGRRTILIHEDLRGARHVRGRTALGDALRFWEQAHERPLSWGTPRFVRVPFALIADVRVSYGEMPKKLQGNAVGCYTADYSGGGPGAIRILPEHSRSLRVQAHELGHALGLDHAPSGVMHAGDCGTAVTRGRLARDAPLAEADRCAACSAALHGRPWKVVLGAWVCSASCAQSVRRGGGREHRGWSRVR